MRTLYASIGYVTQLTTNPDYLNSEIREQQDWEEPEFYKDMFGAFDFLFLDGQFAYLYILADKCYFENFEKGLRQCPFTEQFDIPYCGLKAASLWDWIHYVLDNWEAYMDMVWGPPNKRNTG